MSNPNFNKDSNPNSQSSRKNREVNNHKAKIEQSNKSFGFDNSTRKKQTGAPDENPGILVTRTKR